VLLTGGAIQSPQLLLLSGIGPAEELKAVGVEPKIDRPGVGSNLQDQPAVGRFCVVLCCVVLCCVVLCCVGFRGNGGAVLVD
jgi:choline dehydrogenase-like flavoprotein